MVVVVCVVIVMMMVGRPLCVGVEVKQVVRMMMVTVAVVVLNIPKLSQSLRTTSY